MSLNKHDLDSFRRAKRYRARKIDLLIILLFLLIGTVVTLDHPPRKPGAAVFHQTQIKAPTPVKDAPRVIATARD